MSRRKIPARSNGAWTLSELNPNPRGETLLSPYGRGEDDAGPYMVFQRAHVTTGGKIVWPVLPLGAAKEALLHVEGGGEVGQVGSAREEDYRAAEHGEPTDTPDLVALRREYQAAASQTGLAELLGWDEWLESKGHAAGGSPNASSTRQLSIGGIDPDAKPLTGI